MTTKKTYNTIIVLMWLMISVTFNVNAQSGEIRGVVKNKTTDELLPGVTVAYFMDGVLTGTATDENGFYKIKPLVPGKYRLRFSFVGFDSLAVENIVVRFGEVVTVNGNLNLNNDLPV